MTGSHQPHDQIGGESDSFHAQTHPLYNAPSNRRPFWHEEIKGASREVFSRSARPETFFEGVRTARPSISFLVLPHYPLHYFSLALHLLGLSDVVVLSRIVVAAHNPVRLDIDLVGVQPMGLVERTIHAPHYLRWRLASGATGIDSRLLHRAALLRQEGAVRHFV